YNNKKTKVDPISEEVMKYQYRLGHEFYIRLCLLDDIFKYEILDIDTITDMYEG
ncbi:hypothetical protein G210_1573, partial [Candida maltosa Xu316]